MLHSYTIALLLLLATLPAPTASSDTPKSLQFGSTLSDYVKFSPDMSRVKSAHTLCAWVKKMLSGTARSWLTYTTSTHGYELLISDAGNYNYIHNLAQNLKVASTGFNHVIFLRILCKYVLSIAQAKRHASCYVLISITCARPFIFSFTQQQAVYF